MSDKKTCVLAFSGGLDTSFCVPWLREQGYEVATLFVDTGGVSEGERRYIEDRARGLGAREHVTFDGAERIWDSFVVPFTMAGQLYQDSYPLLVSDRYIIVEEALKLCDKLGTKTFAHGCTGMGNDQVRFDLTVRSLGDYEILAPIRDVQDQHDNVRAFEAKYLEERGFDVPAKTAKYSINANVLGVTASGSEIDELGAPGQDTYTLCAHPSRWPKEPLRVEVGFEAGAPVALDGKALPGPEILAQLNERFGAYGVGRGIYTGDTTIGLKGRIVFECPGLTALHVAHRALEEVVLTAHQNSFKPSVGKKWVELVYKGFFFEPTKDDVEAFLKSSQRFVSGSVVLETFGAQALPIAIKTDNALLKKGAVYAQSADWGAKEAEGFIRLSGMSSTLWADRHRHR
jgi:argininosuccinate synthase